jgi:hypothetical protein
MIRKQSRWNLNRLNWLRIENAHRVGQSDVIVGAAFTDSARVQQVTVDVRIRFEDIVEQVCVFGSIAGEEGVVEEFVFLIMLARMGSPADDSINCPSTMKTAACSCGSLAMAGMRLPRVMIKGWRNLFTGVVKFALNCACSIGQ